MCARWNSIGKSWRQHAFVPSAPTRIYKSGENYILFPTPDDIWRKYILIYIYVYIYIVFLCMQKEIIGQIVILRNLRHLQSDGSEDFLFNSLKQPERKSTKVMKHLGHIPIQPGQIHVRKVGEFTAYCGILSKCPPCCFSFRCKVG